MSDRPHILVVGKEKKEWQRLTENGGDDFWWSFTEESVGESYFLQAGYPDLILIETGKALTEEISILKKFKKMSSLSHIPIILLGAKQDEDLEIESLRHGAADFISRPFRYENLVMRIKRVLEEKKNLRELTEKLQRRKEQIDQLSLQSVLTIAHIVDSRDHYANGHSVNVAVYSRAIARRLGWQEEDVDALYNIALLHDIGKITVQDSILNKPDKLSEEEYEIVKKHTVAGNDILKDTSFLADISQGVLYYHEHYDGTGYMGLSGEDIPISARIIAIADAYDAMKSDRAYRKKLSDEKVFEELMKGRGTQFDPAILDVFMGILSDGMEAGEGRTQEEVETEGVIGVLRQVFSETVQETQSELEKDSLTGFLNRRYFEEKVRRFLRKRHAGGTFFMMDLDDFKRINDTYGHLAGDTLILAFTDVLRENTRERDYVCRMGGDEFAVFFPDMDNEKVIRERAQNIIRMFSRTKKELGYEQCSVSIGIAVKGIRNQKMDYEAMYSDADKALYYVKNNGKDDYHFYSLVQEESWNTALEKEQLNLDQLLRRIAERKYREGAYAVEYDRFSYIYQFIARNVERNHQQVQIILLTLENAGREEHLEDALLLLETAVIRSLRRGDVTTRFSSGQQIVILMDTNPENGRMVAERILSKYGDLAGNDSVRLNYDITSVPLGEIVSKG